MMSTQSKVENGVIQSSIVLLQERFKQLQRVKEMRENRELLRVFSDCKNTTYVGSTNNSNISLISNNKNNIVPSEATMQYNSDDNSDDDELQIFIPPNYFGTNNRKSSCYSSSTTMTTTMTTTSSYSQNNSKNHINLNDVSLNLWPPMSSHRNSNNNVVEDADPFRSPKFEESLSKMKMLRPTTDASKEFLMVDRHSLCTAPKLEDTHMSDVDTTLHL